MRLCTTITYEQGQLVYYKRRDSNRWKGPRTVIGQDNHHVLVKHGGVYVRVNPCSLRPVQVIPEQNVSSEKEKDNDKDCETPCSQDIPYDNDFIPAPNTSNTYNLNIDSNEGIDSACVESRQLSSTKVSEEHNSDYSEGLSCNPEQLADEEAENLTKLNGKVPAKGTRIHYQLPDSSVVKDAIVISRPEKSTGVHKYWFNVKDVDTDAMKSINFNELKQWSYATEDILINSYNPNAVDIIQAKSKELQNWKDHNVYSEVDNIGQSCISTRSGNIRKNEK